MCRSSSMFKLQRLMGSYKGSGFNLQVALRSSSEARWYWAGLPRLRVGSAVLLLPLSPEPASAAITLGLTFLPYVSSGLAMARVQNFHH